MFEELVDQDVVVDLASPFVCLGAVGRAVAEHFLELTDADLHDLRDTRHQPGELRHLRRDDGGEAESQAGVSSRCGRW